MALLYMGLWVGSEQSVAGNASLDHLDFPVRCLETLAAGLP